MHFAILDTEELMDVYGSAYTSYKLYCNGTYHGSARYREFYDLHEAVKSEFGTAPPFPPKRLFNLSALEVKSRRAQLEKYMQNIGQVNDILQSEALQDFLQRIIVRTAADMCLDPTGYQVFLLNGNSVTVSIDPKSSSEDLLEAVCRQLKLPSELTYYFALYLARESPSSRYTPFKKFAPFELPLAVLHLNPALPKAHRIVIKKGYWDSALDTEILDWPDKVGTNLLFVETVDAINRGWIVPGVEEKERLEALQSKGSRREFISLARTVKGYGTIHFDQCTVDYPHVGSQTAPYLTGRELICPVLSPSKQEAVFRVIRMRCWRLCLSETYRSGGPADTPQLKSSLMFEYLLSRDKLHWVTLTSDEAIWMSSCLQSMVEELMAKKKGGKMGRPEGARKEKTRKTSESLSVSVTVTRKLTSANSAFEGIGDDDL